MSNDTLQVHQTPHLSGRAVVPGDKSISHRALILGALTEGKNTIRGWLPAGDTLATLEAIRTLGIDVQREGTTLTFSGGRLQQPDSPIDCGNAGTCMRLLAGLLAGQPFASVLDGSEQLRQRPMTRITAPLRRMGANIADRNGAAPLSIEPALLSGTAHHPEVASAQVKSAILLAGLHADGETTITEPGPSRDHTERMLQAMRTALSVEGRVITLHAEKTHFLEPLDMIVPGDLSSAAFLIAAALLAPASDVTLPGVGLNPTRTGLLDALARMGAKIEIGEEDVQGGEPTGTLHVRASALRGTVIEGDEVVRAIDELPVLAVMATQAEGETVIRDAAELRVKEVDRIGLLAEELRKLGATVEEQADGMVIEGPTPLRGARVSSHGDHRLGMALAVAGLAAQGATVVEEAGCIGDSYPGFGGALARLGAEVA